MLPAKSAVGIVATRGLAKDPAADVVPPRDILLLHPDGRLGLYVGSQAIATVALDTPSSTTSSHTSKEDLDMASPAGVPQTVNSLVWT